MAEEETKKEVDVTKGKNLNKMSVAKRNKVLELNRLTGGDLVKHASSNLITMSPQEKLFKLFLSRIKQVCISKNLKDKQTMASFNKKLFAQETILRRKKRLENLE